MQSVLLKPDAYMTELEKRYKKDPELAALFGSMPDAEGVASEAPKAQRSKYPPYRKKPEPNLPHPMPADLKFMFTQVTEAQTIYMWNVLTSIFFLQCVMIVVYAWALSVWGEEHWTLVTVCFGLPFAHVGIQHIYVDHDVMHGATFPPLSPYRDWQAFLTHPFSDFLSLPWEEFITEHMQHHASTFDLLKQGEFGWDPEMFLYTLMDPDQFGYPKWVKYFSRLLIPPIHFFGLNDTGLLFFLEWCAHRPAEKDGGKCDPEFWSKVLPRRLKHIAFVWWLWLCVYTIGRVATGHGLMFMLCVSACARCGYGGAWIMITNFTHSHPWNQFIANDPHRSWPVLHTIMAYVLGGRHRWNEMLFHDVHHTWPNKLGTLSMRGRFNEWDAVHDAAAKILMNGLWKREEGTEETVMDKNHRKRSLVLAQRIEKLQK